MSEQTIVAQELYRHMPTNPAQRWRYCQWVAGEMVNLALRATEVAAAATVARMKEERGFDGDGVRCDVCDKPFTEEQWGDRHEEGGGIYVYHEDCCPECAIPSADDWSADFDPENLAAMVDDAAEAAIG